MELDFDKYCKLKSGSPNTVLPSPRRRSKTEKRRNTKIDPIRKDDLFTLKEDFTDINFHRFRSVSCKNAPPRTSGLERNEVLRRGSVYQSSTERRKMEKIEEFEGRKKIELSEKDSIFSSYEIVDSLCSSDEDTSEMKRSSVMSKHSELCSEKVFPFDFSKEDVVVLERAKTQNAKFRETSIGFHKSLSAKLAVPSSPSPSENDSSRPSNPKTRFNPIRKMFDPFTKSKSQCGPLGTPSDSTKKAEVFRKSLVSNSAKPPKVPETVCRESSASCSPAHLRGCLKLESKNGSLFFEFSLNSQDDVLVAMRWKTEKDLNWVYTFHTFPNKRKSNAMTQWELKDLKKASSMMGKMQVSCCLNTEMKRDSSMITEFVLYDVTKLKDFDLSAQRYMEIAACVVQVPHEKRGSLKHKSGARKSDHSHPSLLDLCASEDRKNGDSNLKVNVVVPAGTHGQPCADVASCGPSSLLDRWRSNGECDCGSWDMGCPLTAFGNRYIRSVDNCLVLEKQHPLELFVKGGKDDTPAFVIRAIDEKRYIVDFHAKLSTLQAFSMCVAILHCTDPSINATKETENQLLKSDSLRVFVEDEISDLLDSVAEEEKIAEVKKLEEIFPSFKIKPPFSPMARV